MPLFHLCFGFALGELIYDFHDPENPNFEFFHITVPVHSFQSRSLFVALVHISLYSNFPSSTMLSLSPGHHTHLMVLFPDPEVNEDLHALFPVSLFPGCSSGYFSCFLLFSAIFSATYCTSVYCNPYITVPTLFFVYSALFSTFDFQIALSLLSLSYLNKISSISYLIVYSYITGSNDVIYEDFKPYYYLCVSLLITIIIR